MDTLSDQSSRRLKVWFGDMSSPLFRAALALGVLVHLLGFFLFRVYTSSFTEQAPQKPFVQYLSPEQMRAEDALELQSMLFDSAPLFIPTRWNAHREPPALSSAATEDGFLDDLPEFSIVADLRPEGVLGFAANDVVVPSDLLGWRFIDLFSHVGSEGEAPKPTKAGGPVLRVFPLDDMSAIQTIELPLAFSGRIASLPEQPVKYFVQVSGSGLLIAPPLLGSSSGQDDFDQLAREWIESSGLSVQLPAGFLTIEVYP